MIRDISNQNQNLEYWENRANEYEGHELSWWDINMKQIEINTVSKFINPYDYVLDVGCSNGSSTKELQSKVNACFHGIDYSEKAINKAKLKQNDKLTFSCCNILDFEMNSVFDKVISIRCIINLMNSDDQIKAIKNIHTSLKPDGIYIMNECFIDGFENLNRARILFGLKPLPTPKHNNYIDNNIFEEKLNTLFNVKKIIKHASLYYIGTRVFQYLSKDDEPNESNTVLHKFFGNYGFETNNSGDFSPNKVYILKKI